MAGDLNTHDQVYGLFTNFTWTKEELGVEEMNMVKHWSTAYTDVFIGLIGFVAFTVNYKIKFNTGVFEKKERKKTVCSGTKTFIFSLSFRSFLPRFPCHRESSFPCSKLVLR